MLRSTIKEEEKKIELAYSKIGKDYFDIHSKDETDPFYEQMKIVIEAKEKISECKEQIKVIKNIHYCEHCGAEVPNDSLYCSVCHTPVPGKQIYSLDKEDLCPKCGAQVKQGLQYCTSCGTQITSKDRQVNVSSLTCPQCGTFISADLSFCTKCGTKVKS